MRWTPSTMRRTAHVLNSVWFKGLEIPERIRIKSLLHEHGDEETLPSDLAAIVEMAIASGDAETGKPYTDET